MPRLNAKSRGDGRSRLRSGQTTATAVLCLCTLLVAWRPGASAAEEPTLRAGSKAPVLNFKDCAGKTHEIDWSKGTPKAAVLFFFDPKSPPCLLEMSFLDPLHARARDFGLAIFAIESKGRTPEAVGQALERYCAIYRDPSLAMIPDTTFRLSSLFKVRQAPTTFLVDGSGTIVLLREGFEKVDAVEITRAVEGVLGQQAGFFSPALRGLGITAEGEEALMARLAARVVKAEETQIPPAKTLLAGDRVPLLEFTDLGGRGGRWDWPSAANPARVVLLWAGMAVPDAEALSYLERIYAAARDAGLEVLAVESGGLEDASVKELMDRYRKFHPPPTYPVVADPAARFEKIFGKVERSPRAYLVGADGVVVRVTTGFAAEQEAALTQEIERLLRKAGRNFPPLGEPAGTRLAPSASEEAPSIRQRRERTEAINANLKQGDYVFYGGNWEQALPYYLRVIEIDPQQVSVVVRVARIYERLGEAAKAGEMWQRVLALQPDNAEARARLKKPAR